MPVDIVGDDFMTMVNQPGSPTYKRMDNDFLQITYTFVSHKDTAAEQLPIKGVEIDDDWPEYVTEFQGHQVIDAEVLAHESPAHRILKIVFGSPNMVKYNSDKNFERRELVTGILEKAIQSHPKWSNGDWNSTQKEQILALGIESYVVAAPIYRRMTRPSKFVWTQNNVVENVSKRDAPTSMADATADNWLKMDRSVSDDEGVIEINEEWQYSDNWDTGGFGIYETTEAP